MRCKQSQLFVVAIILIFVLTSTILVILRPSIAIVKERELVGPSDDVFLLLLQDRPLNEIITAINNSDRPVDKFEWLGTPLLSEAIMRNRDDLALWLIENGANVNGTLPGTAPLRMAVSRENVEMVRILLQRGAKPDEDLGDGMTIRWIAENVKRNQNIIDLFNNITPKQNAGTEPNRSEPNDESQ